MEDVENLMGRIGGDAYIGLAIFGALVVSGLSENDAWALLSPEQRDAAYHEVLRIKREDVPRINRKGPRSV